MARSVVIGVYYPAEMLLDGAESDDGDDATAGEREGQRIVQHNQIIMRRQKSIAPNQVHPVRERMKAHNLPGLPEARKRRPHRNAVDSTVNRFHEARSIDI